MKNYSSDPSYPKQKQTPKGPQGLGGWLIFMMLILIAVTALQLYMIRFEYPTYLGWFQVTESAPFRFGFMVRIVADIALIVLAFFLIYLYITRSYRFPDTFILWAVTHFLTAAVMDAFFFFDEAIMPSIGYPSFLVSKLFVILIAVTVPYFLTARRVQNTFTSTGEDV